MFGKKKEKIKKFTLEAPQETDGAAGFSERHTPRPHRHAKTQRGAVA